jgi:acetoin utilization deacetylase AcuC-like enzyme
MAPGSAHSRDRTAYYYDADVAHFHFGPRHPMKPYRLALTHTLVLNYGLLRKMDVFRLRPALDAELATFHRADYLDFLKRCVRPPSRTHVWAGTE